MPETLTPLYFVPGIHRLTQYTGTHQLLIHVLVTWRGDKDGASHEASEAPVDVRFVLHRRQYRGQQVTHALVVAHVWISHCVV